MIKCTLCWTSPHTKCVFCCCEICGSAALPGCCLLVCFRGSPLPLEYDFVKATAAAELNCLALWSNQKHTQQQPWQRQSILFEWRLCREGLLPRKLGQLLSVKDCVWQCDPGGGFHSESSCVTRTNTHRVSLASSALLYFPPTRSACGLVVATSLHIWERERKRGYQWSRRHRERETEKHSRFFQCQTRLLFNLLNVKRGYTHTNTHNTRECKRRWNSIFLEISLSLDLSVRLDKKTHT